MWFWCWIVMGYSRNKMVKKPILLLFGASSGIATKLIKFFKKDNTVIAFYNNNDVPANFKIKKIKLNLLNDKDIFLTLSKFKKKKSKIIIINFASVKNDEISAFIRNENLNKTFQINTFSFLKIIQTLLPSMIKNKWGRVINISSTGGLVGDRGTLLYTASKNASLSMMKVMSQEYANFNITFNTLLLGNFNFGMFKRLNKKTKDKILKKIPSKKTGKIINIYNAIKFLITSDYVNGASIKIDGGYLD